jgi:hypothetical protein
LIAFEHLVFRVIRPAGAYKCSGFFFAIGPVFPIGWVVCGDIPALCFGDIIASFSTF